MKKSFYNIEIKDINNHKESILYNSITGASIKLNQIDFNNFRNSKFDDLKSEKISFLLEQGFLIDSEVDEFLRLIDENKKSILNSTNYNLVIAPSSNCQLGCDYCGQSHSSNNLNAELEDKLIKRVNSVIGLHKLKSLSITWYGGEPLISLDSINRLLERIHKIEEIEEIHQSIITNGILLTPRNFNKLINIGINTFQVTIDGDEEVHNERRPLKNSSNSFKRIYKNLNDIFALDIFNPEIHRFNIRINVDKRNLNSVRTLLLKMANDGFHKNINISIAPVHSWENELSDVIEDKSTIADMEINLYLYMHKLGYKLNLLPERVKNTCIMTSKAGELIDAFGNIYNCTEAPYTTKIMANEKYVIGNLSDDAIKQNNYLSNWFDVIAENDTVPCRKCVILPICGGACPKKWIDDNESPCPTYKFNIKDRVLLNHIKQNIK